MTDTGSFDKNKEYARETLERMLEKAKQGQISPEIINQRIMRYREFHKEDDYIIDYYRRAKAWYKSTQKQK